MGSCTGTTARKGWGREQTGRPKEAECDGDSFAKFGGFSG